MTVFAWTNRAVHGIIVTLKKDWSVYIVRCVDDSLYTGVAKDVTARLERHNSGRGAAYTRSRRPVSLAYLEKGFSRSKALSREAAINNDGLLNF